MGALSHYRESTATLPRHKPSDQNNLETKLSHGELLIRVPFCLPQRAQSFSTIEPTRDISTPPRRWCFGSGVFPICQESGKRRHNRDVPKGMSSSTKTVSASDSGFRNTPLRNRVLVPTESTAPSNLDKIRTCLDRSCESTLPDTVAS